MYNFQLIENLSLIVDKMGSEIEKFSSSKNELILPKNPIIHLTFFEHSLKPNYPISTVCSLWSETSLW